MGFRGTLGTLQVTTAPREPGRSSSAPAGKRALLSWLIFCHALAGGLWLCDLAGRVHSISPESKRRCSTRKAPDTFLLPVHDPELPAWGSADRKSPSTVPLRTFPAERMLRFLSEPGRHVELETDRSQCPRRGADDVQRELPRRRHPAGGGQERSI